MQSLFIFLAIILGILLPYGHEYTGLFRPNLMVMLFFSFLGVHFSKEIIKKNHFVILGINITLPLVLFSLFQFIDTNAALAVFAISIAPTAVAGTVLADIFKRDVSYVTASILITSPIIAFVLPLFLPFLIEIKGDVSVLDILYSILSLIFIPLLLSIFIKKGLPQIAQQLLKIKRIGFVLFIINIYIASANARHFLESNGDDNWYSVGIIALSVAIVCLLQFTIGSWLGRPNHRIESGLSLGRKNTMFALWVCLTFISPLVALGPMFYIIFQNLYNTWQLLVEERKLSR
ncbi:MAG: bile acid:sodium symporter family protein [Saprospiraceae bacterium]